MVACKIIHFICHKSCCLDSCMRNQWTQLASLCNSLFQAPPFMNWLRVAKFYFWELHWLNAETSLNFGTISIKVNMFIISMNKGHDSVEKMTQFVKYVWVKKLCFGRIERFSDCGQIAKTKIKTWSNLEEASSAPGLILF